MLKTKLCLFLFALSTASLAVATSEPSHEMACCVCPEKCDRFTGFFLGVNLGGLINRSHAHIKPAGSFLVGPEGQIEALTYREKFNNGGFTGGAQIGYHYQYNSFFIGLETDFDYSSLKKTQSVSRVCTPPVVGNITYHVSQKVDWYGTLRPKIGFVIDPVAVYAMGGLAYGHIKSNTHLYYDVDYGDYFGSYKKTHVGWTVGGGLAVSCARHWFVNIDYLYINLGNKEYTDYSPTFADYFQKTEIKTHFHDIRIGLNYLF